MRQLSERDFVLYSGFLQAVGIKTSLLSVDSKPESYCASRRSINFTDNNVLPLLRTQYLFSKEAFAYQSPEEVQRVAIVDEADTLVLDKIPDSYNYSENDAETDQYTWLYKHLIHFADSETFKQYKRDPSPGNLTLCYNAFMVIARTMASKKSQKRALEHDGAESIIESGLNL